jgi:LDH2 family malate/lactate/ureidoglycolate dehydrogenase
MAIEVITGILSGGAYADLVSSKEAAPNAPEGTAHTMIAIDIGKSVGVDAFQDRIGDLIARLTGLPVNSEAAPARYPGQRRWKLRGERLRGGIPVTQVDLEDLEDLARAQGVSLPAAGPG